MDLTRRNLLVEYGPYGPSLRGLSVSLGRSRTGKPFGLDPELEKERMESSLRRRERMRELAIEWLIASDAEKSRGGSSQRGSARFL